MPKILNPKLLPATSPQFVLALQSPLYQAARASTSRPSNEEHGPKPTTRSRVKSVGLRLKKGSGVVVIDKCGTRRAPTGPVRGMRGALANKTYARDSVRKGVESGWVNVLIAMEPPAAAQIHSVPIEVKEVTSVCLPESLVEVKQEIEDETPLLLELAKKRARGTEVVVDEPLSPGNANKRPRMRTQLPEAYISEQLREAVEKAQDCNETDGTDDFTPHSRNERHVRFLNCVSLVLQESSGFFKRTAESGSFQPSYDELRTFQCNAKRLMDEVEHGIHLFRIKEIQRIDAERVKAESATAAEHSNLLSKIESLKQENASVRTECTKLGMEVERLSQEIAEAERKRLEAEEEEDKRLEEKTKELATKYDEEVDAVGREFVALQGKGICQMCFRNPRDGLILPCLHLLYCYQCLDKHKLQSKECPWESCGGRINALLLCNLTGESGHA